MFLAIKKLFLFFCLGLPFFLLCHADLALAETDQSVRTLFSAIQQRDLPEVSKALEDGADPNVRNPDAVLAFQTPLALAVSLDDSELVSLLLAHGADIDLRVGFWHNLSPLYLAVRDGNLPMVEQLVTAGARIDPNRWTHLKEILAAPVNLLRGHVLDLHRPPSLIETAETTGNQKLVTYLKQQGAR